jgi:hypothetical protein
MYDRHDFPMIHHVMCDCSKDYSLLAIVIAVALPTIITILKFCAVGYNTRHDR